MATNVWDFRSTRNHISALVDNVNGNGMGRLFSLFSANAEYSQTNAQFLSWDEITQRMNVPAPYSQFCGVGNRLGQPNTMVKALAYPYIHVYQDIDCNKMRGYLDPMQGKAKAMIDAAKYLKESFMTRMDLVTAQQLISGTITIEGPGIQTQIVNLGRNPAHTIALAGGALWNATTSTPLSNLNQWDTLLSTNGATFGNDLILGATAWEAFSSHASVTQKFQSCCEKEQGNLLTNAIGVDRDSALLRGTIGNRRIWTSSAQFTDFSSGVGVATPLIPANRAIMVGDVKAYLSSSMTKTPWAGYSNDLYVVGENPKDCEQIELHSSPLFVFRNINATVSAVVV